VDNSLSETKRLRFAQCSHEALARYGRASIIFALRKNS
jgi:hypothetical protein